MCDSSRKPRACGIDESDRTGGAILPVAIVKFFAQNSGIMTHSAANTDDICVVQEGKGM